MPLFMDRHDVPGATAKDVADAHVSDLEASGKHGVQFLSYWFDAENGGVFCFANAPGHENLEAVHRESHGLIPNEIITVDESDVLRFLGRIHDPEDHTKLTSPFRTILFTDLVNSTALLQSVGETEFMALLGEHDLIVRRAIVNWRGREVKHTGDGIMAVFDDVASSLACALEVRGKFAGRRTDGAGRDLEVRIGMAAGRPVDRHDDIYGSAVVLASRLCDAAEDGTIYTSDEVYDRGAPAGYRFREVGPLPLKGFPDPVPAFVLVDEAETEV
jgi:class 3 adenylate cyclase